MIKRTLKHSFVSAMQSGDAHVTNARIKSNDEGGLTMTINAEFEAARVASQFDELKSLDEEQLVAADKPQLTITIPHMSSDNDEVELNGSELIKLEIVDARRAYGKAFVIAREVVLQHDGVKVTITSNGV